MIIGRLLLRMLLVPLGGGIAICVAMIFVTVAHWNRVAAVTGDDYSGLTTYLAVVPMMAVGSGLMLLPATLGGMIAEAFAIRSWMYHVLNGGLSAAISLASIGGFQKAYDLSDEPLIAIGAGIAAGFAYWLVAGWSAGFWKPVFARPQIAEMPVVVPAAVTPLVISPPGQTKNEIAGQNPAIRNSTIRLGN
jgi:hypothetical protein